MGIMGETPLNEVEVDLSLSSMSSTLAVLVVKKTKRNSNQRRVSSKCPTLSSLLSGSCGTIVIALLLLVSSSFSSSSLGSVDASTSSKSLKAISVGVRSTHAMFPSPLSHRLTRETTSCTNSASSSMSTRMDADMGMGMGGALFARRRIRNAKETTGSGGSSNLREIDTVLHITKTSIVTNTHGVTPTQPETSLSPIICGGAASTAAIPTQTRGLLFWENMICGAVSRSVAQVLTHPANTMKTLLQSNRQSTTTAATTNPSMTMLSLTQPQNLKMLTRGAGAQFVLSVPHGAINFAVLECVRSRLNAIASRSKWAREKEKNTAYFGPTLDFLSSAIATCACSVVSTPQMMILDNIMAGTYPNLVKAVGGLSKDRGVMGFYTGWWPGLAGKIPSYALTWTLFQQLKRANLSILHRTPTDIENAAMGCLASATAVCVMIPMDTIKTRLVTQLNYPDLIPYKGIVDCAIRISREEGGRAFYRGLTPRLCSVVPMIGIQFGVYEFMKKVVVERDVGGDWVTVDGSARDDRNNSGGQIQNRVRNFKWNRKGAGLRLEEVMMEVAADDDQPFPAPHLRNYEGKEKSIIGSKK